MSSLLHRAPAIGNAAEGDRPTQGSSETWATFNVFSFFPFCLGGDVFNLWTLSNAHNFLQPPPLDDNISWGQSFSNKPTRERDGMAAILKKEAVSYNIHPIQYNKSSSSSWKCKYI